MFAHMMYIDKEKNLDIKVKPGDVLIVFFVAVSAILMLSFFHRVTGTENASTAIIEVNGKVIDKIQLGRGLKRKDLKVKGFIGTSVVRVEGKKIKMLSSPCRDKICIGMGWAEKPGSSIICMPNRVVIRLKRSSKAKRIDAITE